jgi:hypothetical protein
LLNRSLITVFFSLSGPFRDIKHTLRLVIDLIKSSLWSPVLLVRIIRCVSIQSVGSRIRAVWKKHACTFYKLRGSLKASFFLELGVNTHGRTLHHGRIVADILKVPTHCNSANK